MASLIESLTFVSFVLLFEIVNHRKQSPTLSMTFLNSGIRTENSVILSTFNESPPRSSSNINSDSE